MQEGTFILIYFGAEFGRKLTCMDLKACRHGDLYQRLCDLAPHICFSFSSLSLICLIIYH